MSVLALLNEIVMDCPYYGLSNFSTARAETQFFPSSPAFCSLAAELSILVTDSK